MANESHLSQLRANTWNTWRIEHPEIQPDLSGIALREHVGERADLAGFDFSGVDFTDADLTGVNFGGDDQTGAELLLLSEGITHVEEANAPGTDLSRAIMTGANLRGAYLFMADLSAAVLKRADLSGADLALANLSGADLSGSTLAGASLRRTSLNSANLCDVDLSGALHLRTARGGCNIDSATLARTGMLPIEFLRRCGASQALIDEARARHGIPPGTLSCFLCHATVDRPFVDRLHADLSRHGIKCWYSPIEMRDDGTERSDDEIQHQLEAAIDVHDRTLVVLSKTSICRPWVKAEIRRAEKEDPDWGHVKQLVFVRIDQAHERAGFDLRWSLGGEWIVDFCDWQEHDRYDNALQQVVQILRGEEPEGELISGGRFVLDRWWKPYDVVDVGRRVSADERPQRRRSGVSVSHLLHESLVPARKSRTSSDDDHGGNG